MDALENPYGSLKRNPYRSLRDPPIYPCGGHGQPHVEALGPGARRLDDPFLGSPKPYTLNP